MQAAIKVLGLTMGPRLDQVSRLEREERSNLGCLMQYSCTLLNLLTSCNLARTNLEVGALCSEESSFRGIGHGRGSCSLLCTSLGTLSGWHHRYLYRDLYKIYIP